MKTTFFSTIHPEMNLFWARLERALKDLPNNPKPSCEGFYVCDYNFLSNILNTEKIGVVPVMKEDKYRYFASKKVAETLYREKMLSRNFAENNEDLERFTGAFCLWLNSPPNFGTGEYRNDALEMSPGSLSLGIRCVGISGHDSMVDEAIAVLFLAAFGQRDNPLPFEHPNFWNYLYLKVLDFSKKNIPDNKWIGVIASEMSTL